MARFVAVLVLLAMASCPGHAQTAAFVAPPRTIADITAILDQKLDPEKVAKMRSDLDAVPPVGAARATLATFYYDRGQARLNLGRVREALADAEKALEVGKGQVDSRQVNLLHQSLGIAYSSAGDPKKALQEYLQIERDSKRLNLQGSLFNTYKNIVKALIVAGDLNQAETYVRKSQALMQESHSWPNFADHHWDWEKDLEISKGDVLAARGRFREAEDAYHRAEEGARQNVILRPKFPFSPPRTQLQGVVDQVIRAEGMMKARQGRMAEGEADVRRALLSRLEETDKYSAQAQGFIKPLATLLLEQGRYAEAEKLARAQIEIQNAIGFAKDSQQFVDALSELASILNLQGRWAEAVQVYGQLDEATAKWESARKDAITLNTAHIATMYNADNLSAGIEAANRLLARQKALFGEQHVETAFAHGTLAIGLSLSGRDDDALHEFKLAIPILESAMRNAEASADTDDPGDAAARAQGTQSVIESYIGTLARVGAGDAASETFRLAELIRGRSVQQALVASSARATAGNPVLADLVRQEQDLGKQIGAQLGQLNNVLASPPEQRDDKIVRDIGADVERLRAARTGARQEIARRFPTYADLIDPKPPNVDEIKATLKPDEALLSFYFGIQSSFVWAVPKDGAVVFAAIPMSAGDIDGKIRKLRKALEPEATTIDQIPPFDLALAYDLYALLLQPVEAGWKPAKSLIMVTNGLLGELPLSLLPTTPVQVDAGAAPLFASYRQVPWLARSHAVTVVPSASALLTLRHLPPGSSKRDKLIGFGDPYFNEQEAIEAERHEPTETLELASAAAGGGEAAVTRGLSFRLRASPHTQDVDSADLAMLPRLPDTRAELIAMARALGADPDKALYLGREANEHNVESIDLSRFRIVAFATHGLVPGDLNGLTQPALALTAPQLAGVEGDGLLTMEKILRLKLDADWVVLSACNTAAGAGAARRRCRDWAVHFSTRERGRSSSPTGRCTPPRRGS
jgi:tetratricopeptide (TPR) repeat protein